MSDAKFLTRCLQLANQARGKTYPNPMVGAVIVHHGRIIGEGYHQMAGGPHAEVEAIRSVKDQTLLPSSTLYCSLEPCAHHGKTPPCCELISKHKISRVVIGMQDSYHEVNGKGIQHLRSHGIQVDFAKDPTPFQQFNKAFIINKTHFRPMVTLKWAQTKDGFIDRVRSVDSNEQALKISGKISSLLTHRLRSSVSGIVISAKTAVLDAPSLTVRLWHGTSPIPIIVMGDTYKPSNSWLRSLEVAPILIAKEAYTGFTTIIADSNDITFWLPKLLEYDIGHVLVEGGARLLQSFIRENLDDEVIRYTGSMSIENGIPAPFYDQFDERTLLDSDVYEHKY
jgi:diaminohydroxyphosphoribosylaminopyrimidine deaminase/5-amino-6-(5-phosphoribosylamino)uracil reductase